MGNWKVASIQWRGQVKEVRYQDLTDEHGQFVAARLDTSEYAGLSRADIYELGMLVDQVAKAMFEAEQQ